MFIVLGWLLLVVMFLPIAAFGMIVLPIFFIGKALLMNHVINKDIRRDYKTLEKYRQYACEVDEHGYTQKDYDDADRRLLIELMEDKI